MHGNINFVADFPLLQVLKLSSNQFSGSIPSDIFRYIQALAVFQVENNFLNGTFPETFGTQRNLIDFRISWNEIEGNLPQNLGSQLYLEIFMAGHNKISGDFPNSFLQLSKTLKVLVLSYNLLSYQIPSAISNFKHLQILALDNNDLYGTIPDMSGLKSLQVLWLQNNRLWGSIQSGMKIISKELQDIRLRGNYLDCELYDKYHGFRDVVHSDSPASEEVCVSKSYINPDTNEEAIVAKSIP